MSRHFPSDAYVFLQPGNRHLYRPFGSLSFTLCKLLFFQLTGSNGNLFMLSFIKHILVDYLGRQLIQELFLLLLRPALICSGTQCDVSSSSAMPDDKPGYFFKWPYGYQHFKVGTSKLNILVFRIEKWYSSIVMKILIRPHKSRTLVERQGYSM